VVVSENGCSDTSSCFNIIKSGLVEVTPGGIFSIYPNPADQELIISFKEIVDDSHRIEIKNALGQVLQVVKPQDQKVNINMATFAKGLYFVTVSSTEGYKSLKLLKK